MYLTDETQIEMADFYALLEPLSPEQEEMIDPERVCPDCEGTGTYVRYCTVAASHGIDPACTCDADECEMCHGTGTIAG